MIRGYISELLASFGPALGDHLWQSTLFAVAAGLLTLALRKNHARARYGLWLAASLKFLIPFSVAAGIIRHPVLGPAGTTARFYVAMNEAGQPFTQATAAIGSAGLSSGLSTSLVHFLPEILPEILTAAWFCGVAVVLSVWYLRWRKVSIALRDATPLTEGREVQALRGIERIAGLRKPIDILLSSTALEPGIFGIFRPVLLWPEGISGHLEDSHLEAIIAHEVWHVRRRDNLAAAIHMAVEACFWFHPLVWWLGARLVDERERACDEGVLELGSRREVYAESILKTCSFCLRSRLACMSGVTGADLKKRIVRIMTESTSRRLDLRRKLLLGAAALVALTGPIVFEPLNATACHAESETESLASGVYASDPNAFDVVATGVATRMDEPDAATVPPVAKTAASKGKTCSKSVRVPKPVSANRADVRRKR